MSETLMALPRAQSGWEERAHFKHVYCRDGELVRPMATFAAIVKLPAVWYVGFSRCAESDSFSYVRGRAIALGRARARAAGSVAWTEVMTQGRWQALCRDVELMTIGGPTETRIKTLALLTRYGFSMRRKLGAP